MGEEDRAHRHLALDGERLRERSRVESDPAFGPNFVEPCYEITTYPEGIDFQPTAGSSLSLSDFHSPFVSLCSDFPQTYEVGTEVFLWHLHDGVLEPMLNSVLVDAGGNKTTAARIITNLSGNVRNPSLV